MNLMADTETLGTRPGCTILSLGAIGFDPIVGTNGPVTFYMNIDRASCEAVGLFSDPDTVAWWADRAPEARAALEVDPRPLREVLEAFSAFWADNGFTRLWCQGTSFDQVILEAAYRACGMDAPWKYNAGRDTRTAYELAGMESPRGMPGIFHHALDDARNQADAVIVAFKKLGLAAEQTVTP